MTDYERIYRKEPNACGEPSSEIADFFEHLTETNLNVLDMGCGQGRDALFVARQGHTVLGVDKSETGVSQMLESAKEENLLVEGMVTDVLRFTPPQSYDVVIVDRILHMFSADSERTTVLTKVGAATNRGGHILIADVPKHKALIRDHFSNDGWTAILDKKGFTFVKKTDGEESGT